MNKTRAFLGLAAILIIGVIGMNAYSSGTHYMTFFGIRLSQTGFMILIGVFLVINAFTLIRAFGAKREMEEEQAEAILKLADMPHMEGSCQVSITRASSMVGAAMGVRVLLNGVEQGILKNGKTLTFQTLYAQNELKVHYTADNREFSINFDAQPGGHVMIGLKYTKGTLTIEQSA